MKTRVILNPKAGSAGDEALLKKTVQCFGEGCFCYSERGGHARELARQAVLDGVEYIIAAGGDGTLNEVVNGIAPDFDKVILGVMPLGTGNDFARCIGMPGERDPALELLSSMDTRSIDVGRAISSETRYFINVSAAGFSGAVAEKLTPELKKSWGPLAYLRSAIEALPDLSGYQTRLVLDNREVLETTCYNLVVANARFVAGGTPIAPEAHLDDGLLDVLIVPAASMPELAMLVPKILIGQHLEDPLLQFIRASSIEMSATPGMWFNVDGEMAGNEAVRFEVLPRALRVVVGEVEPGVFTHQ